MRTEKIALHGYLYRSDELWCGCGQAYQIVRHIIKDCDGLEDTRFTYLGVSYVVDARTILRDTELIPKTNQIHGCQWPLGSVCEPRKDTLTTID
jgi:hypothetical protein